MEFSDNGTVTVSYNDADSAYDSPVWRKSIEYYYSISDDNTLNLKAKSQYMDEKAYSYSEAVELINSIDESFWLEMLKKGKYADQFDLTTEQGMISYIRYLLSSYGIFLDENIDYQTALNKYIENEKDSTKEYLDFDFFTGFKVKFIKNEDGIVSIDVPDSATFFEMLSLYESPFFRTNEFDSVNIDIWSKTSGDFWSVSAGDGKTISGRIYAVDKTKIYGVVEPDTWPAPYTEKVEFPYTMEGTGKDTILKVTYAGNTYTLTQKTYDYKLYPAE